MMSGYMEIALITIVGILFPVIAFVASWLLRPSHPNDEKFTIYECGEIALGGDSRKNIGIQFYLFALIFVIFDVEAIFLYPWAVSFGGLGAFAFIEMMIFIGVLVAGYAYAWKIGALEWVGDA
ncbi:MAG: NADH-quinone oxidoreductase subunit A [Candidatus Syntropharchaeales archaeon]